LKGLLIKNLSEVNPERFFTHSSFSSVAPWGASHGIQTAPNNLPAASERHGAVSTNTACTEQGAIAPSAGKPLFALFRPNGLPV